MVAIPTIMIQLYILVQIEGAMITPQVMSYGADMGAMISPHHGTAHEIKSMDR